MVISLPSAPEDYVVEGHGTVTGWGRYFSLCLKLHAMRDANLLVNITQLKIHFIHI